jgi:DNA polymerase
MVKDGNNGAAEFLPDRLDLDSLRSAAACCEGCDLYRNATQTVFGEGPRQARFMLVGEQPGDQEDRQGHPFVGPAGRILDKGLQEAGIERDDVYLTNAVKHFSFTPRGKRRIHQKPTAAEIDACQPWLNAELAVVRPEVVVVLGATAARSLLGRAFKVTQHRGEPVPLGESLAVATIHPSARNPA